MGRKDLGYALMALREGLKVSREGWNRKGMWLELQRPDEHSKMTQQYVYINIPSDGGVDNHVVVTRLPWTASQTDLLAEDWFVV
jgi:hypothetical protein